MRFNQLSVSLYTILFLIIILPAELTPQSTNQKGPFLATGIRIGDVSQTEAVIWTRLTLNKNRGSDAPQPIALYTDPDTGKVTIITDDNKLASITDLPASEIFPYISARQRTVAPADD